MPKELTTEASAILDKTWSEIAALARKRKLKDSLSNGALLEGARRAVNSRTKSYRYVLPTQLIAKLANPGLAACLSNTI